MNPHDKQQLNAFIAAKEKTAKNYEEYGIKMRLAGYTQYADVLFEIAEDNLRHAEKLKYIKLVSG